MVSRSCSIASPSPCRSASPSAVHRSLVDTASPARRLPRPRARHHLGDGRHSRAARRPSLDRASGRAYRPIRSLRVRTPDNPRSRSPAAAGQPPSVATPGQLMRAAVAPEAASPEAVETIGRTVAAATQRSTGTAFKTEIAIHPDDRRGEHAAQNAGFSTEEDGRRGHDWPRRRREVGERPGSRGATGRSREDHRRREQESTSAPGAVRSRPPPPISAAPPTARAVRRSGSRSRSAFPVPPRPPTPLTRSPTAARVAIAPTARRSARSSDCRTSHRSRSRPPRACRAPPGTAPAGYAVQRTAPMILWMRLGIRQRADRSRDDAPSDTSTISPSRPTIGFRSGAWPSGQTPRSR